MVGGFVENEEVGRGEECASEGKAASLATGKHTDGLENVISAKQKSTEQRAKLCLRLAPADLSEALQNVQRWIERLGLVLREEAVHDLVAGFARPVEGLGAEEHPRQRRFTRAVLPHERNLVALLDGQRRHILKHDGVGPILIRIGF